MLDLDCLRLTDEQLLVSFHAGDPAARDHFPRRVGKWMIDRGARVAPDLNRVGLGKDVAQEAWEILLRRPPGSYDSSRGGIYAYLHVTLLNAARAVRAAHGLPALPGANGRAAVPAAEAPRVGQDVADALAESTAFDRDVAETVVADLEAARILRLANATAPIELTAALELVAADGFKWGEAAGAVGLSRFALDRRVRSWRESVKTDLVA